VYLIFNEGYTATSGKQLGREDLSREAIRLGRVPSTLMPDDTEVLGLLALMLFVESRRPGRTTPEGDLVLLRDQDRGLWNQDLISEGHALLRRCLALNIPGPYQIQAAINAVHSSAPSASATDWRQILHLYDHLMVHSPGPIVALNRAVAIGEVEGPQKALDAIEGLELGTYYLFHAIRADLLRRTGRIEAAAAAYDAAMVLTQNGRERAFLERRRRSLTTATA